MLYPLRCFALVSGLLIRSQPLKAFQALKKNSLAHPIAHKGGYSLSPHSAEPYALNLAPFLPFYPQSLASQAPLLFIHPKSSLIRCSLTVPLYGWKPEALSSKVFIQLDGFLGRSKKNGGLYASVPKRSFQWAYVFGKKNQLLLIGEGSYQRGSLLTLRGFTFVWRLDRQRGARVQELFHIASFVRKDGCIKELMKRMGKSKEQEKEQEDDAFESVSSGLEGSSQNAGSSSTLKQMGAPRGSEALSLGSSALSSAFPVTQSSRATLPSEPMEGGRRRQGRRREFLTTQSKGREAGDGLIRGPNFLALELAAEGSPLLISESPRATSLQEALEERDRRIREAQERGLFTTQPNGLGVGDGLLTGSNFLGLETSVGFEARAFRLRFGFNREKKNVVQKGNLEKLPPGLIESCLAPSTPSPNLGKANHFLMRYRDLPLKDPQELYHLSYSDEDLPSQSRSRRSTLMGLEATGVKNERRVGARPGRKVETSELSESRAMCARLSASDQESEPGQKKGNDLREASPYSEAEPGARDPTKFEELLRERPEGGAFMENELSPQSDFSFSNPKQALEEAAPLVTPRDIGRPAKEVASPSPEGGVRPHRRMEKKERKEAIAPLTPIKTNDLSKEKAGLEMSRSRSAQPSGFHKRTPPMSEHPQVQKQGGRSARYTHKYTPARTPVFRKGDAAKNKPRLMEAVLEQEEPENLSQEGPLSVARGRAVAEGMPPARLLLQGKNRQGGPSGRLSVDLDFTPPSSANPFPLAFTPSNQGEAEGGNASKKRRQSPR